MTAFVAAASTGSLQAPYSGATIPAQPVTEQAVGSTPSSSSSTGYGNNNGASSMASTSAALLFAGVASMALLL